MGPDFLLQFLNLFFQLLVLVLVVVGLVVGSLGFVLEEFGVDLGTERLEDLLNNLDEFLVCVVVLEEGFDQLQILLARQELLQIE